MWSKWIAKLIGLSWTILAIANDQVIVVFKPSLEQSQRMKDETSTLQVLSELMHPLEQDKLKKLEKAAGITLDDIGYIGLGGRVLRTSKNLTDTEMQTLIKNLQTVSWVKYANENTPIFLSDATPITI